MAMGKALVEVGTEDLKRFLALLHRGEIDCPITINELARTGLQNVAEPLMDHLRGVDATGTRAVLVAVIAERLARLR
jgi:hypothetical protein